MIRRAGSIVLAACWIACGDVSKGGGDVSEAGGHHILGSSQIGIGAHHDPAWVTQLGGPADDEALAVSASPAGVYIAGHTSSSWFRALGDACDPNLGDNHAGEDCGDAFIMNVATGVGTQFGDRQSDEVKFLAVTDDAVYACGNEREDAGGNYQKDGFAARYPLDLSAATWNVTIRSTRKVDELMGIAVHGAVFAAGGSNAQLDGHPVQDEDSIVTRLTRDGVTEAMVQFGDAGLDELMAIAADDAGVYTTGATAGWLDDVAGKNRGSTDVVLIAHGPTLEPSDDLCRAQFGTKGKDVGQAVIAVGDYLYVAGYTEGRINGEVENGSRCNQDDYPPADDVKTDAFVAKYDKQCQHVWTREFGTKETDAASAIASDGTLLYVAGFHGVAAQAHGGTAGAHAFVRAYDLEGNVVGEVVFDSSTSGTHTTDIGQAVAVDAGFVYVAGGTDGALGTGPSLGRRDVFLAKIPVEAIKANVQFTGDGCD